MFEKLKLTEERFDEISGKLSSPEVISDNELYAKLMKEYKALQKKMRELEIENEILKKATAIFAKDQ